MGFKNDELWSEQEEMKVRINQYNIKNNSISIHNPLNICYEQDYDRCMFDLNILKLFGAPIIYIFWKFTIDCRYALYIGQSKQGFFRIFDRYHPMMKNFHEADALEIIICNSIEEAKNLEKNCIKFFKPKYNISYKIKDNNIIKINNNLVERTKFIIKLRKKS